MGTSKNRRLVVFRLVSSGAFAFFKEDNRLFDGKNIIFDSGKISVNFALQAKTYVR